MSLKTISLKFILQSSDTKEADMQKAIRLAEETYCPVWAMIKNNVEVTTCHEIVTSKRDSNVQQEK